MKGKVRKILFIFFMIPIILVGCSKKDFNKQKDFRKFQTKQTSYKKDNTTEVLLDSQEIKKDNILKIIKHGDHWHVFTKDGKEIITYKDPNKYAISEKDSARTINSISDLSSKIIKIWHHGDHWHVYTADGKEYITYKNPNKISNSKEIIASASKITNDTKKIASSVVKILKHGDHWHIYTTDGKEYITYKDPSKNYPDINIGNYEGKHSNKPKKDKKVISENKEKDKNDLEIISVLGKGEVNREDIVKILKHNDHYHIYDSKGNEGITHTDPRLLYPNAKFGDYESNDKEQIDSEKTFVWPKGITRIIDHGDHWHLYKDEKEVAVVVENPKNHYPDAEYIVEKNNHLDINVENNELFTYDSVEPSLKESVKPYLDENLKSMRHFGDLDNQNIPVYGSNGEKTNVFYWLHGNHYHAITIKQIVQNAKSGEYGENSARDVVAALKYIINHPDESIEVKITVSKEEVKEFLEQNYKAKENNLIIQNIGNKIYIYANKLTYEFNLVDFIKNNGVLKYKKQLPQIQELEKKEEKTNPIQTLEFNISDLSKIPDNVKNIVGISEENNNIYISEKKGYKIEKVTQSNGFGESAVLGSKKYQVYTTKPNITIKYVIE